MLVACSTTWLLVKISPVRVTIIPVPAPVSVPLPTSLATVVLMSTTAGSTAAATAETESEEGASPTDPVLGKVATDGADGPVADSTASSDAPSPPASSATSPIKTPSLRPAWCGAVGSTGALVGGTQKNGPPGAGPGSLRDVTHDGAESDDGDGVDGVDCCSGGTSEEGGGEASGSPDSAPSGSSPN